MPCVLEELPNPLNWVQLGGVSWQKEVFDAMLFQVLGGRVGSVRRVVVEDQVGVAASINKGHDEDLKERQQLKNASALTNGITKSASI